MPEGKFVYSDYILLIDVSLPSQKSIGFIDKTTAANTHEVNSKFEKFLSKIKSNLPRDQATQVNSQKQNDENSSAERDDAPKAMLWLEEETLKKLNIDHKRALLLIRNVNSDEVSVSFS